MHVNFISALVSAALLWSLPTKLARAEPIPTPPTGGTRVLIVTGIDYPGHHWKETTPALKQILEKDSRLKVGVLNDPDALGDVNLENWDVVVLHFMNWEKPSPGQAARDNL
jgi:hypothetical protein